MIKTVFFGTHTFATVILQSLIDNENLSVDLVITQPDKPVGRKKVMTAPPTKVLAEENGITVMQPASLKEFELPEQFDVGVTAQYGLLVPKHILDSPTHSILNVHTSLLPKYRGASPIQSALIHGETETGVTIMVMGVGLDTGPILLQKSIAIDLDDTYLMLDSKLAVIGAEALAEALPAYVDGSLVPVEQDNTEATHCKQFTRDDGRLDFAKNAEAIYNMFRGLTPWPGIWTMLGEKRLKLLSIKPSTIAVNSGIMKYIEGSIHIGTTEGSIIVEELQLEGKQAMTADQFIAGYSQYDNTQVAS